MWGEILNFHFVYIFVFTAGPKSHHAQAVLLFKYLKTISDQSICLMCTMLSRSETKSCH